MPEITDQNPNSRGAGKFRAAKDLSIKTCQDPVTKFPGDGQNADTAEDFCSSSPAGPTARAEYDTSAIKSYRQTARDEAAKR